MGATRHTTTNSSWRQRLLVVASAAGMLATQGVGTATGASPSVGVDYKQCANASGSCEWLDGVINKNKSAYKEGDAVAHRLQLTGLTPDETYDLTLRWQTEKNGKVAYDQLASWNWSETLTDADVLAPAANLADLVSSVALPLDMAVLGNDDFDPDPETAFPASQREMKMAGGDFTGVSTPVQSSGSFDGTGDASSQVTVSFTVDDPRGRVFIVWGSHISSRLQWGTFPTAADINGAPYHMILGKLSTGDGEDLGGAGNRDNQLMASAVTPVLGLGLSKIAEDSNGDPIAAGTALAAGTPFDYVLTVSNSGNTGTNVTVTDILPSAVSVGTLPNGCTGTTTITCTGSIAAANNSAPATLEFVIPVTTRSPTQCEPFTNRAWLGTDTTGTPDATFALQEGGTCGGGPSPGSLTVVKQTDPDGASQAFTFTPTNLNGGTFQLSDGQSKLFSGLNAGSYSVGESVTSGWSLSSIVCPNASATRTGNTITVALAQGQHVTCTFTNTELPVVEETNPSISVVKTALVDAVDGIKTVIFGEDGATIEYEYVVTNTGDVTITDLAAFDDVLGDLTLATTTLAPGQSTTATATHVVDPDEVGTAIVNTVVVTGTAPDGTEVEATDDERVDVAEVLPIVIDRPDPAPDPAPDPELEPTPDADPEIIPRTGADTGGLITLSILLMALGLASLQLRPDQPISLRRRLRRV